MVPMVSSVDLATIADATGLKSAAPTATYKNKT